MPETGRGIRARAHAAAARQYDVATSLIYKWRRTVRTRETGFAEVVVVPDEPVAASVAGGRHQR